MGTIGRLYFYVVAAVSLLVAAFGAGSLLASLGRLVLESGSSLTGDMGFWRNTLSSYIPMLLVGGIVWAIHWFTMKRRSEQARDEQQAILRKLFLNVILTIASAAALFNIIRLLYNILSALTEDSLPPFDLRGRPIDIYSAGVWLLVYALIWYYHWKVEDEEGRETGAGQTLRRLYLYISSFISLWVLGIGAFLSMSLIISHLVKSLGVQVASESLGSLIGTWSLTLAPIAGGTMWWMFHWGYAARDGMRSVLRQLYLYLWIFLGVAGTSGALGGILYQVLRTAFGYRDVSLSSHLEFLQFMLPLLMIGGTSWAYHWSVTREEAPQVVDTAAGVRRRYNYLVAGIGLAVSAVGIARLFGVLLEVAFEVGEELGRAPDWWRDQLSLFIVMAVLGLAVWLPHWQRMQRLSLEIGMREQSALSRRLLLFLFIFAGVLAILFSGALLLNDLLRLMLGEPASRSFLSRLFSNIGVVTVAGLVLFYHWRVLQGDREEAAAAPQVRVKAITAVAAERFQNRVRQLEEALGSRVALFTELPLDGGAATAEPQTEEFSPEEVQDILGSINNAPGDKVLLVFSASEVEIHPYR